MTDMTEENNEIIAEYGCGTSQIRYKLVNEKAYVTEQNEEIVEAEIAPSVIFRDVTYPVVAIEDNAFRGCEKLKVLTIPDSITEIGDWAFAYCRGLTSITIPSSVKKVGNDAFSGCFIEDLYMPESVATGNRRRWGGIFFRRAEDNLCLYCGGKFKGLFTKKCASCGRKKDYKYE